MAATATDNPQPIKIHGGKAYLADWIISQMPQLNVQGAMELLSRYFSCGQRIE
ncbi:MAG: hypothetical protein ACYC4N_24335 [Pirellulaceae bacterium]